MSSPRKTMPTGKKLEQERKKLKAKGRGPFFHYNSSTHKLLLYAKFKKKAFTWDAWNNFHADNYRVRRNSGDCFQQLVIAGFLHHRVIDNLDYFQISLEGELQLIILAEKEQARKAKLSSESSARGRKKYLEQQRKEYEQF